MASLHFLGKNERPGALSHKFNKSHEYKTTVFKVNISSGCNDRNAISKTKEVVASGFSALLRPHLAHCILRIQENIQRRKASIVRYLETKQITIAKRTRDFPRVGQGEIIKRQSSSPQIIRRVALGKIKICFILSNPIENIILQNQRNGATLWRRLKFTIRKNCLTDNGLS